MTARRLLARVARALLYAAALAFGPAAYAAVANDDFTSGGYAGGTGWATSWIEIGETDGAGTGDVAIVSDGGSNRLQVKDVSRGAWRGINLAGAITARLSFVYRRVSLDNANDYVAIEISYNGGTNWYELGRFQGPATDTGYAAASYDISAYATANTRIRSVASSTLGNNDIVYFDNVAIDYTIRPAPAPAQANLQRCAPLAGSGILNTYYPGTASIAAGATSIPVGAPTGSGQPIAAGDTLLVMQMQDAAINATNTGAYGDGAAGDPGQGATSLNNAGRFEYVTATSAVVAGAVNIAPATTYAYTHANASGAQGQRRYQVVRVMTASSGTLAHGLTALAWNGSTGGVLAVDVIGALDLNNAVVDASGLGFRGGGARQLGGGAGGANTDYRNLSTSNFHAQKGEGVAGTPRYVFTPAGGITDTGIEGYPSGSTGRGAPGNAGGGGSDGNPAANDQNTGGGGGGNGGVGGDGGWAWVPAAPPPHTGGFGGASASPAGNRLPLGGGGGAGTVNNNTGTPLVVSSSGAAGGGVILVRAGTISGNGFLFARGASGNVTVGNDAAGGGGAGGSVVLFAASGGIGTPVIDVSGGSGGSNNGSGVAHGPGGGGGGGFVGLSAAGATTNVAGGPNGFTTIIGSDGAAYQSSYGATAGSPGTVTTAIAAGTLPGASLPASCATIASFLINVGAGVASTCTPKHVTITARDASNNVIPGYAGTIALSTSTGRGDWAVVPGGGGGTLANGAANDGAGSYTFVAGDNGVVTLSLSNAAADDLTVNVTDTTAAATATASSTISFRDNAFVVTNDPIQVAGRNQAMSVALWRRDPSTGNCAIATQYSGVRALDAWLARDAADPGGAAPTIGALALPSTAPAANPAANNLSLTFVNGVATFSMATTDVGKYVLNLRDDSRSFASGADITGATNAITTRPFALHVDVPGNPGASTPAGTFFRAAGADFTGSVRAVLWQGADDGNDDGVPDAGANVADNGTTPSYAWPTTLAPAAPYTPATPADAPAGTGVAGALNNGTIAPASFSSGAATVANLQYTEVGSFTLRAAATNYLGSAGVNLATVYGVVGRFRPFDFGVVYNTPRFTTFCGTGTASFTYVGQSFPYAVAPVVTLTARNAQGGTTRNYTEAGGWFKLTNASLTGKAYSALTGTLDTSLVPGTDPVIANTGAGAATLTFADGGGLAFMRTDPVAPFDAEISLAIDVRDTEGVAFAGNPARFGTATAGNGIGFTQGKQMRFGRLRVLNALGSERLALPVPLRLEYWTGSAFATNALDHCTTLAASSIALSNYQLNLGACETALGGGALAFSGGAALATLAAPGAGNNGSVDLRVNLGSPSGQYCTSAGGAGNQLAGTSAARSYLRGRWNTSDDDGIAATTHDDDPVGRAAFGLYGADKAPNSFIYLRENH